jgi:hypothetical protein
VNSLAKATGTFTAKGKEKQNILHQGCLEGWVGKKRLQAAHTSIMSDAFPFPPYYFTREY